MREAGRATAHQMVSLLSLVLAVLFVGLVTYLPHMPTVEGQFNIFGGLENRSAEDPWSRLGASYAGLFTGETQDHPYPLHVDSNVHWLNMATIQRAETLRYDNPYTGAPYEAAPLSLSRVVHEKGFTVAFMLFQSMTGIPYVQLVRFAPAGMAMLTASLVWAALRPWSGAPLAAALVGLVPTTPRFLGIGFFVPVGIGLAWVAAAFLLASRLDARRSGVLLAIFTGWAFFIHLIIGFAALLGIIVSLVFHAPEHRLRAARIAALAMVPLLFVLPAFSQDFTREIDRIGDLPNDPTVFDQLGIPFLFAWALGLGLLVLRPPHSTIRVPLATFGLASVAPLAFIVTNLVLDLDMYALYDRWHQVFALTAAVPAAYGLVAGVTLLAAAVVRLLDRTRRGERPQRPRLGASVAATFVVIATGVVVSPGLEGHLDQPYYTIINDEDWLRIQAIDGLGPQYEKVFAHPWQAPIVTAVTGKLAATWLTPGTNPGNAWEVYHRSAYDDPGWLIERGVSVVMAQRPPNDPGFVVHADRVWVLQPELARQLAEAGSA